MPTKLKNLVITKVALVDEGACSAAYIKLYKRKEGGNVVMEFDAIVKSLPEDQQTVILDAVEKAKGTIPEGFMSPEDAAKLKAEKEAAELAKATAVDEIEGLKKAKAKAEEQVTEEEVLKGLDPTVRAILEKSRSQAAAAEAAIMKMKDEADEAEALIKAKELPNIGAPVEDLAKSLKSLKQLDESLYTNVYGVMKAANELIIKSGALDELGSNGSNEEIAKASDASWHKIEVKAEEIKKTAGISKEQAISKVISENPKMYQEYLDTLK